jgi:Tfp pilus assembly protein PilF
LLFGAAVTMGRDWDIMSLSLLAPLLLCLHQLDRSDWRPSVRLIIAYGLTVSIMTLGFLAANTHTQPAEERFYTLLNQRNRNGWVIYANHFLLKGDTASFNQHMREMNRLFPEYSDLTRTYRYLERGDYRRAYILAVSLVNSNPYEPDFLQVLGNVHGKLQRLDSAEFYYHRALSLKPYHTGMLNELGQLYMRQQKHDQAIAILSRAHRMAPERSFITESLALAYIYLKRLDTAAALADTLFMTEPNDPGAHLIRLTIALNQGDTETARRHYRQFLTHGQGRSDYERMREYYRYLE